MIRRANELNITVNEGVRGGPGKVAMAALGKEDIMNNDKLFPIIKLEKGCGIGYHDHVTNSEIYFITKGSALYNDNGVETTVSAGDVTICPPGEGHGITNVSDEICEYIAVILEK